VVCGTRDPNPKHCGKGLELLRNNGVRITEDVCEAGADQLIEPFRKWIRTGKPYLTLKMAMTLDGRIADAGGKSRWITGKQSRKNVHALRDRVDAVLVGSRTACLDDPSLLGTKTDRTPFRVVVDSSGRLPPGAQMLNDGKQSATILVTTRRCSPARRNAYRARGARVCLVRSSGKRLCLDALMAELGKMGVLHVLCEGGGELAASLIGEGHVDELLTFVSPRVLGGRNTAPVVGGAGWKLDKSPGFRFVETRRIGDDLLLRLLPKGEGGDA